MKKLLTIAGILALALSSGQAQLLISQYVETESGTTPKGIEIWNPTATAIDFSTINLQVYQGTNGGAPTALAGTLVSTGSLGAGEVMVIGTSDIGTYLTNAGLSSVRFVNFTFTFNGDDSLQLRLGGTVVDVFGTPGTDPGSAWTGGGVSTANQNIQLASGITVNSSGFTDPSTRFTTVSTAPTGAGGLTGFGVAPVPEPASATLLIGGAGVMLWVVRRKRALV